MKTTILVVEDEPAIQELIAVNLHLVGYQVQLSTNTQQADQLIKQALPDLILLDWMLPDTPGIQYAKQLRAEARTRLIPIIMLTAKGAEEDKVIGLEAGADDYMTKPFSPKELRARIQAVLRRYAPQLTNENIEIAGLNLNPSLHQITTHNKCLQLGPTEFRLLHFLMAHSERVFSRSQLLDKIWGDHVFIEERTVDVHIRRLRKTLRPTGHDIHIETIRGAGYRFSTKP